MSGSHYQAPKAPVADPPPPPVALGKRPLSVSLASLLLVLVVIDAFARILHDRGYEAGADAGWALLLMPVALMVERGRNWARWVVLVMAALGTLTLATALLVPMPVGDRFVPDYAELMRRAGADLCLVAATILVFGPGRAWFR